LTRKNQITGNKRKLLIVGISRAEEIIVRVKARKIGIEAQINVIFNKGMTHHTPERDQTVIQRDQRAQTEVIVPFVRKTMLLPIAKNIKKLMREGIEHSFENYV
jgi:hypothetical protein